MRSLQSPAQCTVTMAIKDNTEALERLHHSTAIADNALDNICVAKTVSSRQGIGGMQAGIVIRSDSGRHAALRQALEVVTTQRSACHQDDGTRRQRQRRDQAGNAAADNHRPAGISIQYRAHIGQHPFDRATGALGNGGSMIDLVLVVLKRCADIGRA
jgi:hypothetical protein